jgi:TP53 regulating kinase and related kinases
VLVRCKREFVQKGYHNLVDVPGVLGADWEAGWLITDWIPGKTIRACLDEWLHTLNGGEDSGSEKPTKAEELWNLMRRVGGAIGRLHEIGIIHGDLTTSNLMLRPYPALDSAAGASHNDNSTPTPSLEGTIFLIDFGLATQTVQDEDRAVDLYVLERAFSATHPAAEQLFQEVLRCYGESFKDAKMVLRRLDDVRARGRKKSMLG